MCTRFIFPAFLLLTGNTYASAPVADTAGLQKVQQLNSIDVHAHYYKKTDDLIDIKKIAAPTLVIDAKTIQRMGSRRLDEVLREQAGMAVVSDLGAGNRSIGIQMQGFSSAYVLVLLNGLPLSGRFNENFDISRISVQHIERIEIIKGASSSLYGSEALGGVINIITPQHVHKPGAGLSALYGTYNTADISAFAETPFAHKKGTVHLSGDYYRTDGFNVNTEYLKDGQTAPPYHSFSGQTRASLQLNAHNTLQLSARAANRNSTMTRSYGTQPFRDQLDETDINAALSLRTNLNEYTRLLTRYYFTHYGTDQDVQIIETGKLLQENKFSQQIQRLEIQGNRLFHDGRLNLTGGVGGELLHMRNSTMAGTPDQQNYFGYMQANFSPNRKYGLIAGLRYDGNSLYGGKLNPTAGVEYTPFKWWQLKWSVGQGFKAPTYAQSYQVFTNITQGYTVVGANTFHTAVEDLKKAGLVQSVWSNAASVKALEAETAVSWNLGSRFTIKEGYTLSVNGFYNNIRHLINTEQVGIMRNGQQLFSYLNLGKAYTTGLEASLELNPLPGLKLTGGYQYLVAKSRDVEDSIRNSAGAYGKVRSDQGIRSATTGDYFGLPNRSRHMATMQVYYTFRPWALQTSIRASYRSKYGFLDIDNNGYIDNYDIFVKGYTLLYLSIQKSLLKEKLMVKFSIDNISNYTDYLMPAQPGRVFMGGISYRFGAREK
ncbi:TonB-dependent receptor plug domain-containing protein [Chitinophaga ginsengisegetis]|uniref:TonB-dependent receptor plug domain-containing protein n=1 Tax=Chitinophaga ginsengisegetis TaxID=393003 RepID=UPI000DC02BA7|nr:TonB-dependent receptor [Chitinophaga ginsengisegetis]MDR6569240.1 outer membrane receptor for ferrienterochelin and colicins [Chitinophaga ginsengisegetis]MDR6648730.1 outer membrane receptor for ferrienterochelin and colicins [Chitinophaga ginsengisegetis]MDR6655322.1 outer membrane receptor for ferrienterochelin and colicins [Chitinophaga ginsengisegetis]